jgi:hypothetical protein
MAVTSVEWIWDGRGGSDDGKVRTRTRVARVFTDDPLDDSPIVEAAVGVVQGDPHPNDFAAKARSIQSRQGETRLVWLVTVEYSSEKDIQPNPLNDPVRFNWTGEGFQRPLEKDRNGEAVLNSAGDPFDPAIMRDDNRPVVHAVANVAVVPVAALNYRDVVNSDAFTIQGISIAAGKAKIRWIDVSDLQERNGVEYYTLSCSVHLNKDGWNFKPLDQGYREKDGTDRKPILDAFGKAVTQPVLLDGSGAKLADPKPSNAVFLDFEGYEELAFGALPFFS